LTRLVPALVLALFPLAGCARPPAPAAPAADPGLDPRVGPWTFGRELVLPHSTLLMTPHMIENVPAGSKVRVAGDEDGEGYVPVLVLDGPHAGKAGGLYKPLALAPPDGPSPTPSSSPTETGALPPRE
jgi:hypothetical protein